MTRATIETDAGSEIQCAKCNDYWPSDPEFFYFTAGRPHSWCKACYLADPKVITKRQHGINKLAEKRAAARTTASASQ